MNKKLLFPLLVLLLFSFSTQAQMFTFNFTGTGTCPNTQGNSVIQPPNASVLPLSRNGALNCSSTNDYFNTASWSQASAIDATQYIELTITAAANSRLNLTAITFQQLKSSTGPATCRVSHNATGDFTTTSDFTPSATTTNTFTWDFPDFTTGLGATVKFRIYGWGASGSTGTLRINNLSVYGSAITNSPLSYDYTNGYVGVGLGSGVVPTQRLQVDGGNILLTNGRLLVGTIDATSMNTNNYLLGVNGTAIVNKLIVKKSNLTAWPDYIFDDNYKPIPLDSLQSYLKINHHLPDVPCAEEVERNDIDVSNTQSVLLKKVEELTLYIIDQNKQIIAQREQQSAQQQELLMLQKQVDQLKASHATGRKLKK